MNRNAVAVVVMGVVPRLADALRGLAAAAVLLSAVIHLDLYESGYRNIATIGPLFLLQAVGGVCLAVVLLVWRHWLPALACAGFGALTVAAYWVSVEHGLFGLREVPGGWAQTAAAAAEYVAFALGLGVVALLWWRPDPAIPVSTERRLRSEKVSTERRLRSEKVSTERRLRSEN